MTNNTLLVSVPRELLQHALNAVGYLALRGDDVGTSNVPVADALRSLLDAPAEDVRAVVEDRTPQDYAIEHAGFLATAADQVLADYQAYSLAQMLSDEGGDDGEAELTDAIDEARDDLHEGLRNLREMAYEFRKRRDRAIPQ